MRGPGNHPESIPSRNATSVNARKLPTSRTEVNPARSVSPACLTPMTASWAPLRITSEA